MAGFVFGSRISIKQIRLSRLGATLALYSLIFGFLTIAVQDQYVRTKYDDDPTYVRLTEVVSPYSDVWKTNKTGRKPADGGASGKARSSNQILDKVIGKSPVSGSDESTMAEKALENETRLTSLLAERGTLSESESYKLALSASADKSARKLIILSLVDEGFIQMALNFYEVSLKPYGLDRLMLFIGLTNVTCTTLRQHNLSCFVYSDTENGRWASLFHSAVFLQKMNIRTDVVLEALRLGYTVLHTDLDLVYFMDPLLYIPCYQFCDLAALIDKADYNAGFIYLRPTNNSIWIYSRMKELAAANPSLDDQDQLTQAIQELDNDCINFHVVRLDTALFQNGLQYYELSDRTFSAGGGQEDIVPCTDCVVMHNNWIVSVEAKVYRFKEMHLWFYDGPDRYYTDPDRKYLAYSNPLRLEDRDQMDRLERDALVSALSMCQILNRTLILPKFHCYEDHRIQHCGLNSKFNVASFDAEFGAKYREHTFLAHPLVPAHVASKSSTVFLIRNNITDRYMAQAVGAGRLTARRPADQRGGATPAEILHWFVMSPEPVLRFHSLYGALSALDGAAAVSESFAAKLTSGLRAATYRQL